MAVRLIALDIDGTLLNSRWEVSPANREAIAEATRRGIEVALVTGRRYDFALPVAQQIPSPLTMIVNNGAMVRTKQGHTHVRHLLPKATARRVLESTEFWREGAAVVFDRPQANQVILEKIDWEDPTRGGYYTAQPRIHGRIAAARRLPERGPHPGNVYGPRCADAAGRARRFAMCPSRKTIPWP